jgi:hypothetical protein
MVPSINITKKFNTLPKNQNNFILTSSNQLPLIENYPNLWFYNLSYYQYNIFYQRFNKQITDKISLCSTSNVYESWDDIHNEWFILNQYNHYSSLEFHEFFLYHHIDIPTFFKKSKSLLRPQRELILLRLITYLTKHGLKLKIQNNFINALHIFFTTQTHFTQQTPKSKWQVIFLTLQNNFFVSTNTYCTPQPYLNYTLKNESFLHKTSKHIGLTNLFTVLYKNIDTLLPVFSFYIYKVDKQIFKNTRGKSGKFTFIWKYITPYKRRMLVMYWLSKELKLKNSKTLKQRLQLLLHDLIFNPNLMWASKIKRFSYNYVYRNCRYSLAENYRTSTK